MCLGDVARVVELDGPARAVVQLGATAQGRPLGAAPNGRRLVASLLTLDTPVSAGDWVLVHSGFALSRLTPAEAAEALAIRAADPARAEAPIRAPSPNAAPVNPALTPKDVP